MDRELETKQDYYKVLEVDYEATVEDIRSSYHRLALKWHPDKHKGDNDATAMFQEINEAYSVLSDASKRFEYDIAGNYEIDKYSISDYLTRFKGMILTCNGLGINHISTRMVLEQEDMFPVNKPPQKDYALATSSSTAINPPKSL